MTDRTKELAQEGPIVFYDGECGLCDWSIQRLVRIDKSCKLRYATLQGSTAKEIFPEPPADTELWSLKLIDESGVYDRSTACLRALAHVGGAWKLALVFLVVPKFIRDGVYRFVALNRRRWVRQSCLLPGPTLRERFLP